MKSLFSLLYLSLLSNYLISQTTIERQREICKYFNSKSVQLTNIIDSLKFKYREDTLFISNLNNSQNNWLNQTILDVELYMPQQEDFGSSKQTCKCNFYSELYEARIEFLNKWNTPGKREGTICGGTIIFEGETLLIIDGIKY